MTQFLPLAININSFKIMFFLYLANDLKKILILALIFTR